MTADPFGNEKSVLPGTPSAGSGSDPRDVFPNVERRVIYWQGLNLTSVQGT